MEAVIALAAMSIRNLDERVKERLRVRAARHGRSMEAEIRAILTDAVSGPGEAAGFSMPSSIASVSWAVSNSTSHLVRTGRGQRTSAR